MYRKKHTQALVLSEVSGVHCGYWNVSPVVKGELCVCMCVCVCVCVYVLVAQLCLTLCNPMDCSKPGFTVWNSPGMNTGVGSHSLLQGIFPTQGSNLGLLHCKQILYCLSHQGGQGGTTIFEIFFLTTVHKGCNHLNSKLGEKA